MDKNILADCEYRILCALRRIIRAVDVYSRKLNNNFGLTTPQLLCLQAVALSDEITLSVLTKTVNLSGSTVNGIVDRLEAKKLLYRQRSTQDRRKVYLIMTSAGQELVKKAPSPLQDKLSNELKKLSLLEQLAITQGLERTVEMMELEQIDASPNLISNDEFEVKK